MEIKSWCFKEEKSWNYWKKNLKFLKKSAFSRTKSPGIIGTFFLKFWKKSAFSRINIPGGSGKDNLSKDPRTIKVSIPLRVPSENISQKSKDF